jgi:hypothetical protein
MRPTGSKYWLSGYPNLVAQWHPTKNGGFYPDEISYGSGRRIWWKCAKGPDHEWSCTAKQRTNAAHGTQCPFCAGKRVSVTNNLAARRPRLVPEWHPTKNGRLKPTDVTPGSMKTVWWKCPKGDDHAWRAKVVDRGKAGCPFCSGAKTAKLRSLAAVHPEIARQWHPQKNAPLRPSDVMPKANRRVWWRCQKDRTHDWTAIIASRTMTGDGCPYCSGHRVSRTNSLAASFPAVAKQWHKQRNGRLTPGGVYSSSSKKFWWKCPVATDHEWRATVVNRTRNSAGCPFCAGQSVSATNSLAAQRPELARQWHSTKNKPLRPADVVIGSARPVWWRCANGHVWRAQVRSRAVYGTGCVACRRTPS